MVGQGENTELKDALLHSLAWQSVYTILIFKMLLLIHAENLQGQTSEVKVTGSWLRSSIFKDDILHNLM